MKYLEVNFTYPPESRLPIFSNVETFYNKDLSCKICRKADTIENENHLLQCNMLESEVGNKMVTFDDVFGSIEKQKTVLKEFKAVLRKRDVILKYHGDGN